MIAFLKGYGKLEDHILKLIYAEFFIQLGNASFFLLINYFLDDLGYADHEIAEFRSYRFMAVLLFAFPFGLFIKGRRLKPIFMVGVALTPLFGLCILYSAQLGLEPLLKLSLALWGIAFTCIHVTALPYVMLNAKKETHSEAIAMFFQTWIVATILVGGLNYILLEYFSEFVDKATVMYAMVFLGFIGNIFVWRIDIKEQLTRRIPLRDTWKNYDWKLIGKAIVPNVIIAVGAGFTIPFINLFFLYIHGIQDKTFSLMGAGTFLLVSMAVLIVPAVKRKWGYKATITLSQSLAVVALIGMALTEWYSELAWAAPIAIFFYLIRQPLMNVAGPMASEMTMYYVGKRNQELISALNASIWSGSWFVSARIFQVLREMDLKYGYILLITAAMYTVGVGFYYALILDYHKRKAAGLSE